MASFVNPKLWSAAFWVSGYCFCIIHCGIFEMLAWESQCITSDLEGSGEGSIELVAVGTKILYLDFDFRKKW